MRELGAGSLVVGAWWCSARSRLDGGGVAQGAGAVVAPWWYKSVRMVGAHVSPDS